jgi:Ca-activated chloride channel homolog
MSIERTPEMDRLLSEGLAHLRAMRWEEAVVALSKLRELGGSNPEVDQLLAQAQLKAEVARSAMPDGAPPPTKEQQISTRRIRLAGVIFAITAGLIAAIVLWPQSAPIASVEPQPTPKVERPAPISAQSSKVEAPKTSALLVRFADGKTGEVQSTPNIEVILDASGSMLAKIGEQPKIDIAHQSLDAFVQQLPDNTKVALRSYGHRRTNDCSDLELVAPLGPLDRGAFMEKVRSVRARLTGRTPIEASIRAAAEDLRAATGETLLVLVSDGDETCDGDPARAAADLRAANPNVRVSVIGFDIGNAEWQARLQAIAEQGGGSYFDAADASQLAAALQQAVQLTYRVVDARGREVYTGPVGSVAQDLPNGEYRVEVGGPTPFLSERVRISGTQTTVELRPRGAGYVAQILRR